MADNSFQPQLLKEKCNSAASTLTNSSLNQLNNLDQLKVPRRVRSQMRRFITAYQECDSQLPSIDLTKIGEYSCMGILDKEDLKLLMKMEMDVSPPPYGIKLPAINELEEDDDLISNELEVAINMANTLIVQAKILTQQNLTTKESLDQSEIELNRVNNELKAAYQRYDKLNNTYQTSQEQFWDLELHIQDLNSQINTLISANKNLEKENSDLTKRLNCATDNISILKEREKEFEEKLETEMSRYNRDTAELRKTILNMHKDLNSLEYQTLNIESHNEQNDLTFKAIETDDETVQSKENPIYNLDTEEENDEVEDAVENYESCPPSPIIDNMPECYQTELSEFNNKSNLDLISHSSSYFKFETKDTIDSNNALSLTLTNHEKSEDEKDKRLVHNSTPLNGDESILHDMSFNSTMIKEGLLEQRNIHRLNAMNKLNQASNQKASAIIQPSQKVKGSVSTENLTIKKKDKRFSAYYPRNKRMSALNSNKKLKGLDRNTLNRLSLLLDKARVTVEEEEEEEDSYMVIKMVKVKKDKRVSVLDGMNQALNQALTSEPIKHITSEISIKEALKLEPPKAPNLIKKNLTEEFNTHSSLSSIETKEASNSLVDNKDSLSTSKLNSTFSNNSTIFDPYSQEIPHLTNSSAQRRMTMSPQGVSNTLHQPRKFSAMSGSTSSSLSPITPVSSIHRPNPSVQSHATTFTRSPLSNSDIRGPATYYNQVCEAIQVVMEGEFLYKSTRSILGTEKRKLFYFWVNPQSKELYFCPTNPGTQRTLCMSGHSTIKARQVYIKTMRLEADPWTLDTEVKRNKSKGISSRDYFPDPNFNSSTHDYDSQQSGLPVLSILIETPQNRTLKLKACSERSHKVWETALSYLNSTIPINLSPENKRNHLDYHSEPRISTAESEMSELSMSQSSEYGTPLSKVTSSAISNRRDVSTSFSHSMTMAGVQRGLYNQSYAKPKKNIFGW